MLRKICVLVVISVLTLGLMACSKEYNNDSPSNLETSDNVDDGRPTLELTYQQDGKEVTSKAGRGGYSYAIDNKDGTKKVEIADAAHVLQWSEELMPIVVMEDEGKTLKITLHFNKKVTNCKVIAWEEKYFGKDTVVQESYGKDAYVHEDGVETYIEVSPGYIYEVKAEGEDWNSDFGFHVVTDSQTSQVEEFQAKSSRQIQEILGNYPDTFDELSKYDEIFLILHGNIQQGEKLWDTFYQKIQDQRPAELVMAQVTVEGDPILYYLTYDGNKIHVVEDVSRDAFKGNSEDYTEYTYSFIRVFEDTQEDGKGQYIMLLNDDSLTLKDIQKMWDSGDEEAFNECWELAYINTEE